MNDGKLEQRVRVVIKDLEKRIKVRQGRMAHGKGGPIDLPYTLAYGDAVMMLKDILKGSK